MTDKEILEKAIQKAIEGGWKYPIIGEYKGVDSDLLTGEYFAFSHITRSSTNVGLSAISIIFNHDFAKALWGEEEVDNNGWSIKAIRMWANQVAVKHGGKLYNVDPSKKHSYIMETPEIKMTDYPAPDALVEVSKVEYELEKMTGAVPFETHKITSVDVEADTMPVWQYHLQQMVISDDPIQYLGANL